MSQVAEGSPVVLAQVLPRSPTPISRLLLALLPVWIFLARTVVIPDANEPIFANPPSMLGLPFGIVLSAFAFGLMAVGVLVMARTTSRRSAVYVVAFLTAPSTALVTLAPAIMLGIIALTPQTGAAP